MRGGTATNSHVFHSGAQVLNMNRKKLRGSVTSLRCRIEDSVPRAMNVLGFGRRSTKGVDALDLTRHGGYNPGPIPVVEASPRPPVTRISMADSAVPLLRGGAESHPLWDAGVPKHDAQSLRSLRAPGEDPTPTSIMAEIEEFTKMNKAAGGRSSPAPAPPDIESAFIGRV